VYLTPKVKGLPTKHIGFIIEKEEKKNGVF